MKSQKMKKQKDVNIRNNFYNWNKTLYKYNNKILIFNFIIQGFKKKLINLNLIIKIFNLSLIKLVINLMLT